MDVTSGLAAASIGMRQASLGQAVSTAVMKKVMDTNQQNGSDMVKLLESAAMPHLGASIDIRA